MEFRWPFRPVNPPIATGKTSRGRKVLTRIATVLLLFLVLFTVVLPYGCRIWVRNLMKPEQAKLMEGLTREPSGFPPAWADAPSFSPDVIEAAAGTTVEWKAAEKAGFWAQVEAAGLDRIIGRIWSGGAMPGDEWTSVSRLLGGAQAAVDAVAKLVAKPEYDLAILDPPLVLPDKPDGRTVAQTAVRIFVLRAHLAMREERPDAAFGAAMSALRLGRRHPASTFMVHVLGAGAVRTASRSVAALAPCCGDREVLGTVLTDLRDLSPLVRHTVLLIPGLDVLGRARNYRREGYPIRIDVSMPVADIFGQVLRADSRFAEWKLDRMQPGDPQWLACQQYVRSHSDRPEDKYHPGHWLKYSGPYRAPVSEFLLALSFPPVEDFADGELEAAVRFDFAHIAVAARCHELREGRAVTETRELVPRYIAEEPRDPFWGTPYRRDAATKRLYSVGPDRRDDHAAIEYDPTNGTASAGDIWMAWR